MSTAPFRTVFAIYAGMTHLDFTGPHQFLSQLPNSETLVASVEGGTVEADGLAFANTLRLEDIARCDLVCVPGGLTATDIALDGRYIAELQRLGHGARYVTSVCTGSLVLGAAGFLAGKRAACHWAWRDLLALYGAVPDSARVVRDGKLITGGGVTAGMDFALAVLAEVAGEKTAQTIQLGLEYAPAPPFQAGSPDTAPPEVLAAYRRVAGARAEQRRRDVLEAISRL